MRGGVTQIILGCNTAHLFLDDVFEIVPEAKGKVINIIDESVSFLLDRKIDSAYLLATEGTIVSGVYDKKLGEAGISCVHPREADFKKLRFCIEAVKQNKYGDDVKGAFLDFVKRGNVCILGCTELPLLYEKYMDDIVKIAGGRLIIDPLYIALSRAKKCYLEYIGRN